MSTYQFVLLSNKKSCPPCRAFLPFWEKYVKYVADKYPTIFSFEYIKLHKISQDEMIKSLKKHKTKSIPTVLCYQTIKTETREIFRSTGAQCKQMIWIIQDILNDLNIDDEYIKELQEDLVEKTDKESKN